MRHWKKVTLADYAQAIRKVAPEHFVLGSDLGQYLNPLPTDGMQDFLLGLRAAGLNDREIDHMARKTPRKLL